jgi:hypothetical protein
MLHLIIFPSLLFRFRESEIQKKVTLLNGAIKANTQQATCTSKKRLL